MKYQLAMIGAGNMAEAILKGCLKAELMAPDQIVVVDPVQERREMFAALGMAVSDQITESAAQAEQIMLAVKPQVFPQIADAFSSLDHDPIYISIMAGLTSEKLNQIMDAEVRLVRVMPNTPLLVGLGMSGVALGVSAKPGDEALTMKLFSAAGEVVFVEEPEIDGITAVSGSGPAYLFYLAESMMEAAATLGLSEDQSALLVKQTLLGAANLLNDSEDDAATLRRKVSSPGGTTEAAINLMEDRQVRPSIADALRRAAERSRELGSR